MTRLTLAPQPFSPEEIAKIPTEAENFPVNAQLLRNRAFANLPGLLHAAEKLNNKERN